MIYFIQQGTGRGPTKIGFARGPADCERRLVQLQTGNPERLVLVAIMGGGFEREAALHQRFAEGRLRGEWFAWDTPGLQDLISEALHEQTLIDSGYRYCEQCGVVVVLPPRRKLCGPECEREKKIKTARAWKKRAMDIPVVRDLDAELESALLQVISDD